MLTTLRVIASVAIKRDDLRMNRHRASLLFALHLFGKSLHTFPDHALAGGRGGPSIRGRSSL